MTTTNILSAHPLAPGIQQTVQAELVAIEAEHEVTILFAGESGSRGWGFASPDSEYDVRFIYVHRLPWYLTVEDGRDVIERPISDELDISGWELRKALRLLRRSNPVLFEWLDSPIVYRQEAAQVTEMRALLPQHFSTRRSRYHYLAMAKNNFRDYLQSEPVRLKKYLYVLRPLLAAQWIDRGLGMPPMRFAELAEAMLDDTRLIDEINALLAIKMRSGESETSPRWPHIHDFIETVLAKAEIPTDYKSPQGDAQALDDFLLKTVVAFTAKSAGG